MLFNYYKAQITQWSKERTILAVYLHDRISNMENRTTQLTDIAVKICKSKW